jgi:hypothetical protein
MEMKAVADIIQFLRNPVTAEAFTVLAKAKSDVDTYNIFLLVADAIESKYIKLT